MEVPDGEEDEVVEESHQVVRDMKTAGVDVLGGGTDKNVEPVAVAADDTVAATARLTGLKGAT